MKVGDTHYRSIWRESGETRIIDQRWLPHEFRVVTLRSTGDFAAAIADMWVRGAPLIGATAAYGVAEAMAADPSGTNLDATYDRLLATRPTAVNLRWALDDMRARLAPLPDSGRALAAMPVTRYEFDSADSWRIVLPGGRPST